MVQCRQCGHYFGSQFELSAHLMSEHGLNVNPPKPRSLANLYEVVEALTKRLGDFIEETEAELAALDSRLEDLEEPDV